LLHLTCLTSKRQIPEITGEAEVNRTSFRRVIAPSIATLAVGLSLTACGAGNETSNAATGNTGSKLSGTLNGAGSSAQEAAFTAWRSAFQTENSGVTVNYDPVGSGGGREQFLAGGVQFAGSDSYLSDEELAASKDAKACNGVEAFDVPSYISPIAVMYNLHGVDGLQLSAKTIANIFNGTIKKWNDPAIAAENDGAKLPSTAIAPVHRADDSGTTKNFTDYLSKAGEGAWKSDPDGVWPLKSGEAATGTSGVVEAVTNGAGTIGYADHSQVGSLQVAKIKVGTAYVEPSAEGASKTVEVSKRATGRPAGDIAIDVDRTTTEAGAYPIILVSYVIACPTYAKDAELIKAFLSYVVSTDGQAKAAKAAGSAPLPAAISTEAATQLGKVAAK
jgi:phosphate transport system substrate-binding protein